jgi:cell division inhibitor SulA/protein ImuA
MGRASGQTVETGYPALSAELPGGGWPQGACVELLVQQAGVGEIRLLAPALATVSRRPVAVLRPPHLLNAAALQYIGLPLDKILLVRPKLTADALWSAEQILKTGSCGALLFWQEQVRPESLRRLQVAAKSGEALFFVMRPLARAGDSSPAELRLTVRPCESGVSVSVIKRKGPSMDGSVSVELRPSPVLLSPHARVKRPVRSTVRELADARV